MSSETEAQSRTYRRLTFDQIFNMLFRGTVYKSKEDRRLVSDEEHFDSTRTQDPIVPSYFTVTSKQIAGAMYKQPFSQAKEGVRRLENIKCYPIDLVTQVDDNGTIIIDEETQKPLDAREAKPMKPDEVDPQLASRQAATASRVRFWIALSIILTLVAAVLVGAIVWLFRGTSYSAGAPVALSPSPAPSPPIPAPAAP